MTRKLLLGVVLLITIITAALGAGMIYAYFSDTNLVNNNTFTAGTLTIDLTENNGQPVVPIKVESLKPGDFGIAARWNIINSGTVRGDLAISIPRVTDNENVTNRPKLIAGAYDNNGAWSPNGPYQTNIVGHGVLSQYLQVMIWVDMNNNNVFDKSDYYLASNGSTVSGGPMMAYPLDSLVGKTWTNPVTNNTGSGTIGKLRVDYLLPDSGTSHDNIYQSDNSTFDIMLTLTQHR